MTAARYAVLGWPIAHSVSPQMQGAAFAASGMEATYEAIAAPPDQLPTIVQQLREKNYSGWNITVPHKRAMTALVDHLDPVAEQAGSVNTVVNCEGTLRGYSTDGYGLATAVRESFGLTVKNGRFMFCGCGGAARATLVYFAANGAKHLSIVNRTLEKAAQVSRIVRAINPDCQLECLTPDQIDAVSASLRNCDVLVQATSLGLHADDPLPLPPDIIPANVAVMDMIYRQTPFLAAVAECGRRTADGRGMLLHQGAKSFELWTGLPAPLEAMRGALDQALATGGMRDNS